MEYQELLRVAGGDAAGTATLEDRLEVRQFPIKLRNALSYTPTNTFLGIYTNKWKFLSTGNLQVRVYSSFIDNPLKQDETKLPDNRWKDGQTAVLPCHGMRFGNNKEWATILHRGMVDLIYVWLRGRSHSEEAAFYVLPFVWHAEKAKLQRWWKDQWDRNTILYSNTALDTWYKSIQLDWKCVTQPHWKGERKCCPKELEETIRLKTKEIVHKPCTLVGKVVSTGAWFNSKSIVHVY